MKEKNKKIKLGTQQKQLLSFKMRMLIGGSCILLLVLGIFIAINLSSVEKTLAGNNGDYRTIKNGEWEDTGIWEMYDGKKWQPATSAPLNIGSCITVGNGMRLIVNTAVTCAGIIVERGAVLELHSGFLTVNKEGALPVVKVYGTLDAGMCVINGSAKFYLADNATLIIGSEKGISKGGNSGNIQVTGTRYYSSFANYVFKSEVLQEAGKGLPNAIVNLEIDNPAGVELKNDLTVTSLLKFTQGNIRTGNNLLTLGNNANKCGVLKKVSGGIQGNFMRWLGKGNMKDVEFPMVENKNLNSLFMSASADYFSGGTFTFSFIEGKPEKNLKADPNSRIISIGESGYYILTAADGMENGIYKLQSTIALSKNENKNYWLVKGKPVEERKGDDRIAYTTFLFDDLTVGPNPFKESFKINFDLPSSTEVEINLMSTTGQVIFKDKMIGQERRNEYEYINNQNLAAGIYYVIINANGKSVTKKVVKQ